MTRQRHRHRSRSPERFSETGHASEDQTECDSIASDDDYSEDGDSNCVFLNVSMHHMKISALVDSGSTINVMSCKLFNSLPNNCHTPLIQSTEGTKVVVANNDVVEILGIYMFCESKIAIG